ncbi:helix-turn-helix domain-containing protein [Oerskovia rustica]|uniref:Helix-turn-helix domain-containing protein n=1 Tax=Oerskovia rustica TaxID=2762237 RepID=A0ABR8RX92_9CELL|nr:helix-turn-helix domain-containing protein [Oerskovia rustica]MBD7952379.1 helix-turn-helix domain-containing protein [Oerskovia rustica]
MSLLSVSESAERLGCQPSTVYRYIEDGVLPAYRIGPKLLRIDPTDLYALIKPARAAA